MFADETFHRRLVFVTTVMLLITGILLARLMSFQFRMDPIVKEQLEAQAANRYSRTVEVYPIAARFTTATATCWR